MTATSPSRAERGRTTIAAPVVAKLASLSAREIDGVVSLGGNLANTFSDVVARVRGDEHRTTGVEVVVNEHRAAVDLSLSLRYPLAIAEVTEQVRTAVVGRVQEVTGLEVMEVNIEVTELVLAQEPGGGDRPRVA